MRNLAIWLIVLAACSTETGLNPDAGRDDAALNSGLAHTPHELTFGSDRSGNQELYTIRLENGRISNITQHPDFDGTPAWSPDGRWLAFVRGTRLIVMRANGTQLTEVASPVSGSPTWSPDGTRLAFMAFAPFPNLDIHVVNFDGTGRQNITNHSAREESPSWSPDGERIVFVSDRDGRRDIYTMRAKDAHHLSTTGSRHGIMFVHAWFSGGDGWGSGMMDSDGGNRRRIIGGSAPATPALSPDGSMIAFIDLRDGFQDLFVVNVDGTEPGRLTNDAALDQAPAWR
jgi:Tol biopolymer transport system component